MQAFNLPVCVQTVVRAILDRVWEKGDIYKAKYEGELLLSAAPPSPYEPVTHSSQA